jgi:hypothetical protein
MRPLRRVAVALLLGALVVGVAAPTGLLTRTVGLEDDTFHVIAKYTPLKLIAPAPKQKHPTDASSLAFSRGAVHRPSFFSRLARVGRG